MGEVDVERALQKTTLRKPQVLPPIVTTVSS